MPFRSCLGQGRFYLTRRRRIKTTVGMSPPEAGISDISLDKFFLLHYNPNERSITSMSASGGSLEIENPNKYQYAFSSFGCGYEAPFVVRQKVR